MNTVELSIEKLLKQGHTRHDALVILKEVYANRIKEAPAESKIEDNLYNSLELINEELKGWEDK